MDSLTIITVSARPQNLYYLLDNILSQRQDWVGRLTWEIVFDIENEADVPLNICDLLFKHKNWINFRFLKHKKNNPGGHYGKDVVIKEIKDGWIYQLDDDNLLFPNFLKSISRHIDENTDKNLFCFWQYMRYFPKSQDDLRCGIVDTAMYFFKKEIAVNINYPLVYGGDGMFLEQLLKSPNTNLMIIQEELCWYNQLLKINHLQDELCSLALKFGTDKFSRHNYCEIYANLFKNYKNMPIDILELGVYQGASLQMWKSWFKEANVYGADINLPNLDNLSDIKLYNADSQNISICDILNWKQFDIIIDDADHHPYSQLKTLWNVWPLLKSGGLYVIEDVQNIDSWKKHWEFLNFSIYDQRNNGGTYDSILLVIRKP